jgi:hypothetical protein
MFRDELGALLGSCSLREEDFEIGVALTFRCTIV